jgi:uroporphyrin-III C-methyltransferase
VVGGNTEKNIQGQSVKIPPTRLDSTSRIKPNLSNQETGILVVGHGSRRIEANEDVREAARRIGERGGFSLVETAFLEIESPNVGEGFAQLVRRGANNLIVHPYFLSPGRHTRGDLPREVNEVASNYPEVSYQITEPLSAHPLVIDAAVERIRETGVFTTRHNTKAGMVYLVGAGPGDPGLLTLRARDLLISCDVILYDHLVDTDILRFAPATAERIAVGKVGGGRCTPQSEINRLMIEKSRRGKRVVRLKGGDPFLFGRGGEETEALYKAGISFEVVPGISSALAVPAYAGIPLTHRDYSSSVAVVTGAHSHDGACNRRSLARVAHADTIVILMGVANLRAISAHLLGVGKAADTPVAVIRWGSYESQQTVTGTLSSIADDVERAGLRAPAVIVVGEVVRLRERLNWFEQQLLTSHKLKSGFAA